MSNYDSEAQNDAIETAQNFIDEIVEQIVDNDEASDDLLNDYPNGDAYHHESHVDKWYSLIESAELIHELSRHEETDSGLWEGVNDLERALGAKAAYTYGNAVMYYWQRVIAEINDLDFDVEPSYDAEGEEEEESDEAKTARIKEIVSTYLKSNPSL